MKRVLVLSAALAVLVASCKDQGPQGLDPIVFARNTQTAITPVTITWFDQSGQVQATQIVPNVETCIHFTSTLASDSVRYVLVVGDTTGANGPSHKQWSPWFDPRTGVTSDPAAYPFGAEYWTLTVGAGPSVVMKPVEQPPC